MANCGHFSKTLGREVASFGADRSKFAKEGRIGLRELHLRLGGLQLDEGFGGKHLDSLHGK